MSDKLSTRLVGETSLEKDDESENDQSGTKRTSSSSHNEYKDQISMSTLLKCPKCSDADIGLLNQKVKGEQGLLRLYYCRICGYSEWFFSNEDNTKQFSHSSHWISNESEDKTKQEPDYTEKLFENDPTIEELEKKYILHLLSKHDGNKSKVARILNISRSTLREKIAKFDI
ncbi:MAG: helix-turn-helix domain-containing protein [Candidatus Scalindua sp.]